MQPKRDMFGYNQLNLNLPMGYVTINPGSDAALNTRNVLNTAGVMNTPTINKRGERQ